MQQTTMSYQDTCLVPEETIQVLCQSANAEIERIRHARHQRYETVYASINAPTDDDAVAVVQEIIKEKKLLAPTMVVVIGIGGSNLGTMAVHQALCGTLYNDRASLKIYYADTVDTHYIIQLGEIVEAALQRKESVIINVVSKSGTTTETAANFHILLALIKQYKPDYAQYIVATTDRGSVLWQFAQQQHFTCLEIPKNVGGRYSVFTAVGLFPLGLVGVDIQQLCDGAVSAIDPALVPALSNVPLVRAAIMAYHYKAGKNIHDMFLFSGSLEAVGKWYRQLLAESIGKEYTTSGKNVRVGITPTVSIGSTDLHSVGQLYLGGPRDKLTTFITVEDTKASVIVPALLNTHELVANIDGVALSAIMSAIIHGTQCAYQAAGLPFVTLHLPNITPYYLGQLLQSFMLEVLYLGFMLDVNPFDQPNVESYKQETRKILAHE